MKYLSKEILVLLIASIASTVLMWVVIGTKTIQENFDGPYYGVVASSWYNKEIIRNNFSFELPLEYYPAHLPFYPFLMSLAANFTGNFLTGGMLVNLISSTTGTIVIYLIWKKNKWSQPFWTSVAWLFLWPRMWAVRSVASPETLFITLAVTSLYFYDKKNYWLSAFAGVFAVLTKTPGMLLFIAYGLCWLQDFIRSRKINLSPWPVLLIPLAFLALSWFYKVQTGDFFAYFNSGDNIHLQNLPFKIFDSNQSWVGSFWLEDVMWIYLLSGLGTFLAFKKNKVWGWFGIVFCLAIAFVSHRDISRYSLPLVPVVLLGISTLFEKKEFKYALLIWIIPMAVYTINFLRFNTVDIANMAPFLLK